MGGRNWWLSHVCVSLSLAGSVVALLCSVSASAQFTLTETFDEEINQTLFSYHLSTNGQAWVEDGELRLAVSCNPSCGGIAALDFRFELAGDFVVMVDYRIISAATPSYGSISCGISLDGGTGDQRNVQRLFAPTYEGYDYWQAFAPHTPCGYLPSYDLSGTLEFRRTDQQLFAYAWGPGKSRTLLCEAEHGSEPVSVEVYCWVSGFSDVPLSVAVDNLEMTADGAELYVTDPGVPGSGNINQFDSIHVVDGGSIVVPEAEWDGSTWIGGYLMLEADTIYVDADSAIYADACGFSKDDGHSDGGPGVGQDHFHNVISPDNMKSADGAGYGGRGGHYWTTIGPGGDPYREEYWDQDDPHVDWLFGSAGGDLRWEAWPFIQELGRGGRGGGYIRLRGNSVDIEGTVTANGGHGQPITIAPETFGGGGGSGGQIVLDSASLTVTGTVEARGGSGSYPTAVFSGGGGAGGRIKILQPSSDICEGWFSVAGGVGCDGMGNGQAGTIYRPDGPPSPAPTISGLAHDTGRDPSDLITSDPRIAGTAEPGSIVRLYVGGALVGSGEANAATGEFSVAASEASDGLVEVTATAQAPCYSESPASDPFMFTLDRQAPDPPSTPDLNWLSDTGRFTNDDITSDDTPTFDGTAEPDAEVVLLEGETVLGGVITVDGNWSVTSSVLSEGSHQISAKAIDVAGNESGPSDALGILIDVTPPVISNPSVTPTNCPHPGQVFDVQATVIDGLSGVQGAWNPEATIRLGDIQIDQFDLDPLGGDVFCGSWDSSGQEGGVYAVDFEAWDLAGNSQGLVGGGSICLAVPADLDEDGDVDIDDFNILGACMAGPNVAYPAGCDLADLDTDGDVDLQDFALFQMAFTGQ